MSNRQSRQWAEEQLATEIDVARKRYAQRIAQIEDYEAVQKSTHRKFAAGSSLPIRVANGLRNSGVYDLTPENASRCSRRELERLHNFGKKSMRELELWLAYHGFELRP